MGNILLHVLIYYTYIIYILHVTQNGSYDANCRIKKVMHQRNIKQNILCVYCFLVKRKKLSGQPNTWPHESLRYLTKLVVRIVIESNEYFFLCLYHPILYDFLTNCNVRLTRS